MSDEYEDKAKPMELSDVEAADIYDDMAYYALKATVVDRDTLRARIAELEADRRALAKRVRGAGAAGAREYARGYASAAPSLSKVAGAIEDLADYLDTLDLAPLLEEPKP